MDSRDSREMRDRADRCDATRKRARRRYAPTALSMLVWLLAARVAVAQLSGSTASSQILVVSDSNWKYTATLQPGWQLVGFDDSSWSTTTAPNCRQGRRHHRLEAGAIGGNGFQLVGFIGPPHPACRVGFSG